MVISIHYVPIGSTFNSVIKLADTGQLVINDTAYDIVDSRITEWEPDGDILGIERTDNGILVRVLEHYNLSDDTPRPEERTEELLPETVNISDIKIFHLSGRTQEEIEAEAATSALENELATLKEECARLDAEAVRALRAVAAGIATDEDQTYLANNEALVKTKRARIAEIVKQLGSTK